ncbi:hypothetical protein [Streptomyces nitrosporeus]|uniref:hypothetical protein n=1 Tax=Streptomyces nitrosporeus TaxID=28894 RepID=UPI0039A15372
MHGYGYPPQRPPAYTPPPRTLVALRVIFVLLTLMSCGFASWASLLRLALVTRRALDWVLMAVVIALNTAMFAYMFAIPEDQPELTNGQALLFLGWMLCSVGGTVTYYLWAEIRHFAVRRGLPAPVAYPGPLPPQGHSAVTVPGHGYPPAAPAPPPRAVPAPAPPPRPATPYPPQRLDQVRAELDELSDYLRKEGGDR